MPKPKRPRKLYLDAWRVLCVECVLITHADEIYAEWNIAAVQQWVLQLILVISGTCFSMSKAKLNHLIHYVVRLLIIVAFGSAVNAIGLAISGDNPFEPLDSIPDKVMFQMAFLGIIAGAAIMAYPLKVYLDDPVNLWALPSAAVYLVGLGVFGGCWLYYVEVQGYEDYEVFLRSGTMSMAMLLLAVIGVRVLPEHHRGWLGWFLLAWLYGTQVVSANPKVGYWFHLSDIYSWSVLVHRIPLMGDEAIGLAFAQGWPFWSVAGGLLSRFPGVRGRYDKFPFAEAFDRARYYPLELLFIAAFVTVPRVGPERTLVMPEVLRPHLGWLNWWSLLAFCTHKGVYYVIPGIPWGLTIVLLSPLPFYAVWSMCHGSKRGGDEAVLQQEESSREDLEVSPDHANVIGRGVDEDANEPKDLQTIGLKNGAVHA